jgi:hypothetical protein
MRVDDVAVYNPFGWRLAEITDSVTDDARRRELVESLVICEAEELAFGRRHLTVVHGDPDRLADSHDLTAFYETIARLVAAADWSRVRGASGFVTVTVAGRAVERTISLLAAAAALANPGWWKVTESPYPDVV